MVVVQEQVNGDAVVRQTVVQELELDRKRRARDERLQRRVAIKVLPPELAFQKDIRERFTREAQTAARLSHPNVVAVYDQDEDDGGRASAFRHS